MLDIVFSGRISFAFNCGLPELGPEYGFQLLFPDQLRGAVVDVHILRHTEGEEFTHQRAAEPSYETAQWWRPRETPKKGKDYTHPRFVKWWARRDSTPRY